MIKKTTCNQSQYDNGFSNLIKIDLNCISIPLSHNRPEIIHNLLIIICEEGESKIEIDTIHYIFSKDHILILFPFQQASVLSNSNDFSAISLLLPEYILDSLILDIPFLFINFCIKHSIYKLELYMATQLKTYITLLNYKIIETKNVFKSQIIFHLLNIFFFDLCNYIHPNYNIEYKKNRIVNDFFLLLKKHMHENKEVRFYANKLCVSEKHLNKVLRNTLKYRSAKEWIDFLLIIEIKKILRNKNLRIKEVAEIFGFSSQVVFFQYFKKHVGISPYDFRKLIE